ncbi:MAG: GAF domain-containing protein [Chloroflexi bacterium]|nr:GAF domain-containing protein [Chloroflexota bacterium]
MNRQFNPFLLIPFMSAVVTACLAWFGWRKRPAAGAFEFFLVMLAVTVWGLGNALELGATNLPTKLFWLKFEYIGKLLLPASWLAFSLRFTGLGHWLTRRLTLLLAFEPILIFLLLLTSGLQPLFFQETRIVLVEGSLYQWDTVKGLFYWVNIAYSYGLILFGSFLLLQYLARARGKMVGGELIVIMGVIFPWMANVVSNLYTLPGIPGVDLTPFALSLTGLAAFAWGLFRLRLLEPRPDGLDALPEELTDWRSRVLNGMLRGIFIIWLFAMVGGINNVVDAYQNLPEHYENPLLRASVLIFIFIVATAVMGFITFKRNIPYDVRAGVFLFILYILGALGLYNAALSGDGRVLFFALIILAAILFDLVASVIVLGGVLLTYVVIGWLQVSETITVPLALQANAADPAAWLSGGIVFLALSVTALTSVTYLLRVLERSLEESRESLRREQRLSRVLRTVSQINQLIVREADRVKLMKRVCETLIEGRGYSFAWIGLLDADRLTLRLAASAGAQVNPEPFEMRLDQTGGPACVAEAFRQRHPIRIETPSDCSSCPLVTEYPLRVAIALPLLRESGILGSLNVVHAAPGGQFDETEVDLLTELADDLAYALEKMEMNRRIELQSRHETLLAGIASLALETTDQSLLLQSAAEKMREGFEAAACYVVLWDDVDGALKPVAASGYLEKLFLQMEVTENETRMTEILFEEGKSLVAEDAEFDARISPRIVQALSIRSILGIPLMVGKRAQGGIFLAYNQRHAIAHMEIASAEQIGREISLSLDRIRLQAETHTKARELGALYAALQDMASSLLDPPALLHMLARHTAEALNVTSSYLISINQEEGTMTTLAEYWTSAAVDAERKSDMDAKFQASDYPTIIEAMSAGNTLVLHRDDPRISECEQAQFLEYDIQTMLFVPIFSHGKLLGEVEIWESRQRREFTQADMRLAQTLAAQASNIIENAQLFAQTRQSHSELAAMLSLAQAVSSSLDLKDVLKQAASSMTDILDVDDCFLSELDPDLRAIHTSARYSRDGTVDYASNEGILYRLAEYPVSERVMFTGNPIIVRADDPQADPSEVAYLNRYGYAVALLLPLRIHDIPLGLAELCSFDAQRNFKPEEIQLARALADQVAVAIDNASLYNRLTQSEAHFRAMIENAAEGVAILDAQGNFTYLTHKEESLTGYSYDETMRQSAFRYIHPDDLPGLIQAFQEGIQTPGAIISREYRLQRKDGTWGHYEMTGHNMLNDPHVAGVVINYRDISKRKQAEESLQESESRLEGIINTAINAIVTTDERQRIVLFNPSAEKVFGYSASQILGQPVDLLIPERFRNVHDIHAQKYAEGGIPNRTHGILDHLYGLRSDGEEFPVEAYISQSVVNDKKYFTVILQDITERKRAEQAVRQRAEELESLVAVSTSLRAASTVAEMTPVVLREATKVARAANGSIFLLEQSSGDLVSRGWYSAESDSFIQLSEKQIVRHTIYEGITGYVARTGQVYSADHLHEDPLPVFVLSEAERLQDMNSGISLPLRAHDSIVGVLHVALREKRSFTETETRLLTAIAEMAGNALQRASLYEKTLHQAVELAAAYDNTLAGWARALELRDELTEGHTRRVTALTMQLSHAMGITPEDLVQIQRGAILHDIGKMGIPDQILLKRGPLTLEETAVMHRHTQLAFDMLYPIAFLRPALDIPYCHHEKWDGTGYPRGLKGEEIPLAARIFAVADVWDAITSDRPYRPAWPREKALEYMQSESAKYFDPRILEIFFSLEAK